MKKVRVSRRKPSGETDWISEVIVESVKDPRLNRKTPRKNRVWMLIVHHRVPGMGLALILKKRSPLSSRVSKKLNANTFYQLFNKNFEERPLCGFYDDFDDSISLEILLDQIRWTIIEGFERFLITELGKKIQERSSFLDSLTLLVRKIQAI